MRTNIFIEDDVLKEAMTALGTTTKRDTVNQALRQVASLGRQREILKLRGKINWVGDLDEMRRD